MSVSALLLAYFEPSAVGMLGILKSSCSVLLIFGRFNNPVFLIRFSWDFDFNAVKINIIIMQSQENVKIYFTKNFSSLKTSLILSKYKCSIVDPLLCFPSIQ